VLLIIARVTPAAHCVTVKVPCKYYTFSVGQEILTFLRTPAVQYYTNKIEPTEPRALTQTSSPYSRSHFSKTHVDNSILRPPKQPLLLKLPDLTFWGICCVPNELYVSFPPYPI